MVLKKRHKELLLQLAEKHLSPDIRLIVYGSRADGTAHDASDLDLALRRIDDQVVEASQFSRFLEAVQDSTIPFPVEIFDWALLPPSFHEAIDDHGITITMDALKINER